MIYYGLQPALLAFVLAIWSWAPDKELAFVIGAPIGLVLLAVLEVRFPARADWVIGSRERLGQVVGFVVLGALTLWVQDFYQASLATPLAQLRSGLGIDVWPHEWPVLAQLLLVFGVSEFLWYWLHRAEHRWPLLWRVSGHGAHHAFKRLGTLNSGLNHPFELFWIAAPAMFVELFFGVGEAATGAALLLGTQAAIVHTNLELNSAGIGWLLTTNRFHIHHHSVVLEESNTNYGCAVILWDRLFGTFSDAPTAETGTGPTEPTTAAKLWMPFVEPSDTATAPGA